MYQCYFFEFPLVGTTRGNQKEKLDNLQDLLCVHYNIAFCFSGLGLSGQQSSGRPKNLGRPFFNAIFPGTSTSTSYSWRPGVALLRK